MKINTVNLALFFLMLIPFWGGAQSSPTSEITQVYNQTPTSNNLAENTSIKETLLFEEAAKQAGIPQRKLTTLDKVADGYYVIAGVFGKSRNAKKAGVLKRWGLIPDTSIILKIT